MIRQVKPKFVGVRNYMELTSHHDHIIKCEHNNVKQQVIVWCVTCGCTLMQYDRPVSVDVEALAIHIVDGMSFENMQEALVDQWYQWLLKQDSETIQEMVEFYGYRQD